MTVKTVFHSKTRMVLRELEKAGGHLGIVQTDTFICLDGIPYKVNSNDRYSHVFMSISENPDAFYDERAPLIGHFMFSNGIAYWVEAGGKLNAGYVDIDALKNAGYKQLSGYGSPENGGWPPGAGPVLFDQGGIILDYDVKDRWNLIMKRQSLNMRVQTKQMFLDDCAKSFAEKPIEITTDELLSRGNFIKADGLAHVDHIGRVHHVPVIDGYDAATAHRVRLAGCFAIEGGVTGFVDNKGNLYIGQASIENLDLLDQSGYQFLDDTRLDFVKIGNGAIIVGYVGDYDMSKANYDLNTVKRAAVALGRDPDGYVGVVQTTIARLHGNQETMRASEAVCQPIRY